MLEIGSRAVLPKGPGVKKKHVTKLSAMMLTSVPALRGARFRLGSAPYRRSISIGKCRDRAGRRRVGSILIHVARQTAPVRLGRTLLPSSLASFRDRSAVAQQGGKGRDIFLLTILFFWSRCSASGAEGGRTAHVPSAAGNGSVIDACRPATRSRMLRFPSQTSDRYRGNWAITR